MASYDQISKNNWRYRISLGKNAETENNEQPGMGGMPGMM